MHTIAKSKIKQMHINLSVEQIRGARTAIIPGDPDRVRKICEIAGDYVYLGSNREYTSAIINHKSKDKNPILVCSTGIGGASLSIAVEEMALLGIDTFLRVGTSGGIGADTKMGDIVIPTGAVRDDGVGEHYAPLMYPAIPDLASVMKCVYASNEIGVRSHTGVVVTSATFYPGQCRKETHNAFLLPSRANNIELWSRLNALSFEMEAATLFVIGAARRLRTACVLGLIADRKQSEHVDTTMAAATEENAIRVVIRAAELVHSQQI